MQGLPQGHSLKSPQESDSGVSKSHSRSEFKMDLRRLLVTWIEDEFVKDMIADVDHSQVISAHIIESPVFGAITPKELSGGVKVLILMLKVDSFIYNLSICGNNCAKWVLEIARKKDLTVYLQHIIRFEGEFEIKIMNTGKLVHNPEEYVTYLAETITIFINSLVEEENDEDGEA